MFTSGTERGRGVTSDKPAEMHSNVANIGLVLASILVGQSIEKLVSNSGMGSLK